MKRRMEQAFNAFAEEGIVGGHTKDPKGILSEILGPVLFSQEFGHKEAMPSIIESNGHGAPHHDKGIGQGGEDAVEDGGVAPTIQAHRRGETEEEDIGRLVDFFEREAGGHAGLGADIVDQNLTIRVF